ncbi:nucleotidyltransferase domain-containing protein [Candidatus Dependentiae bacterium]|nr:nucleotidyltransferase domain-containing protein [Candidatus Dependentiae bacterium]
MKIDPKHYSIVQAILASYPYTFYVFGSRAKDTARPLSDLDLCYKDSIPISIIAHIEEQFEESDLPFTVDLINWNTCSDDFKKLIEKDLVPITKLL